MIKLIASDMDGTLLNSNGKISEENCKAIKKAQELGIQFVIATGRNFNSVEPLVKEMGIKCEFILMNGAEYRDSDGNILESININKSKAKEIVDIISTAGMSAEIYTTDGIYTTDTEEKALTEFAYKVQTLNNVDSFEKAMEIAKKIMITLKIKYIKNTDEFLESQIEIRKIIAFYKDVNVIESAKKQLESIEGLEISSSFRKNIEVTDERAKKGLILQKVIKKYELEKEDVMVLGDSFNDESLFTSFPISFAMGNALPEIKAISKYITDTNNNDGVAKAIYKMIK